LSTKEYGKLRIAERGQLSDNEDMTLRDVEKARERQQQALAKFHETIREAAREFSIREIAKVAGLTKSRIHQIVKSVLLLLVVFLVLPANADATLRMYGDVKPHHWTWARQASANVPLPDARLQVWLGYDPMYDPVERALMLPQAGKLGYDYQDEHILFLHELGHAYDMTGGLDRFERDAFRRANNTGCGWWSKRCRITWNDGRRPLLPPAEWFAEQYAACALGLTREQVDNGGYVTYGWQGPHYRDLALCNLIRTF
jgi:hypothetical protein